MERECIFRANGSRGEVRTTTSSDLGLQWGNRKRLRCMKVKDDSLAHKITARVDRRVVRADKEAQNHHPNGNGYLNLRQRPCSPPLPPPHRILRNSENSTAMREGVESNGGVRGLDDKRGNNEEKEKGGGSSSGSGELAAPPVWPPKFVIALTNKEKEEDFFIFKGSKLPQRPKKRPKLVQRTVNVPVGSRLRAPVALTESLAPSNPARGEKRAMAQIPSPTLNLVCPGGWLCDLTLERYEVREKKISKKKPRGLKAMGNMVESDSE